MSATQLENIYIQERDIVLFRRLCEMGYLDLNQIAQFIFETSYPTTCRRLIKLTKAGYIKPFVTTELFGRKVLVPVLQKIEGLVSDELLRQGHIALAQRRKLWQRSNLDHDALVRTWCLRILKLDPSLKVELEYALLDTEWGYGPTQADRRKIPDFVLIDETGLKVAFEIERHPKARSEYNLIFAKALPRLKRSVVYLCETASTVIKVKTVLEEVKASFRGQGRKISSEIIVKDMKDLETNEALVELLNTVFGSQGAKLPANCSVRQISRHAKSIEDNFIMKTRSSTLSTLDFQHSVFPNHPLSTSKER